MPTTIRNTDILFNDGTTQSTAAGASAYAGSRGQVFASSGSFTVPSGVTSLHIICIGGGGGAGSNFGRPGGYGGYADGFITVVAGTTYTVTVGAGGTETGFAGNPGGESWFGVNSGSKLISATGGAGGPNSATNAANGAGSNGTWRNGNVTNRTLYNGIDECLTAGTVTWSITSAFTPGARGGYASSGCCAITGSGVSGAIFIEY